MVACLASVIQLVPDGVVKAVSSPRGVVLAPRNATRKSASSTGGAASTQAIAAATGWPADGGATEDELMVADVDDRTGSELAVVAPVVCDGVIGVSWVGPGLLTGILEQPATSTDAANNTAIRMPSG